jgi:hypothetical protein
MTQKFLKIHLTINPQLYYAIQAKVSAMAGRELFLYLDMKTYKHNLPMKQRFQRI